jgi:hypothetical protein
MKVKIGEAIYDSEAEPIMLILSAEEKGHIANMAEWATKYCSAPENMNPKELERFMQVTPEMAK